MSEAFFSAARFLFIAAAALLVASACGEPAPAAPTGSPTSVRPTRPPATAPAASTPSAPSPAAGPTVGPATPAAGALSFRSLARGFRLGGDLPQPALFAATDTAALEGIAALVAPVDQETLRGVDLSREAVLGAFWGVKPYGGFSITVTGVALGGDGLSVTVDLRENDPEFPKIEAATLPYHVVAVERPPGEGLAAGTPYRLLSGQDVLAEGDLP